MKILVASPAPKGTQRSKSPCSQVNEFKDEGKDQRTKSYELESSQTKKVQKVHISMFHPIGCSPHPIRMEVSFEDQPIGWMKYQSVGCRLISKSSSLSLVIATHPVLGPSNHNNGLINITWRTREALMNQDPWLEHLKDHLMSIQGTSKKRIKKESNQPLIT